MSLMRLSMSMLASFFLAIILVLLHSVYLANASERRGPIDHGHFGIMRGDHGGWVFFAASSIGIREYTVSFRDCAEIDYMLTYFPCLQTPVWVFRPMLDETEFYSRGWGWPWVGFSASEIYDANYTMLSQAEGYYRLGASSTILPTHPRRGLIGNILIFWIFLALLLFIMRTVCLNKKSMH